MATHTKKRREEEASRREEEDIGDVSDNSSSGEPEVKVQKRNMIPDNAASSPVQDSDEQQPEEKTTDNGEECANKVREFVACDALFAERGNLIEIQRGLYSHWALYCGDGMLVHVTGPGEDITVTEAECRKEKLEKVAGDSLVRVNNLEEQAEERTLTAFDPEIVVGRAQKSLGKMLPYNVFSRNCEHYVTEWRYGQAWSAQVSAGLSLLDGLSQRISQSSQKSTSQSTPPPAAAAMQLLAMFANFKKDPSS